MAVNRDCRIRLSRYLVVGCRVDMLSLYAVDISGYQHNAVRVVASEVRTDSMSSDDGGVFGLGSCSFEDASADGS
jgi:hypothetical protein